MLIKEINQCRICGNIKLSPIIDLGIQYLSGRFPANNEPDPPKAPLILVRCDGGCGLVQLKHSVSPSELYLHNYGYRSGLNQTMIDHLNDIVKSLSPFIKLYPEDVTLDIGSNDATLLKMYPGFTHRIGIDPTGLQFHEFYPNDITLVSDYFNSANYFNVCLKRAKVITSIAMLYDLESPETFVEDIVNILDNNGIWVFEQSYMPTMLKRNAFDTICHEHLEYYSLSQIRYLLERNGLRILDVKLNDTNGGSFIVYASHIDSILKTKEKDIEHIASKENSLMLDSDKPYKQFRERILDESLWLRALLNTIKNHGESIYIYGASTKGNVLLQYLGLDNTIITAAAEKNPEKFGCRTPGTNIPIVSEDEARKSHPDYMLVLPWHFRSYVIQRESQYLKDGGKLIFPLPKLEVVSYEDTVG